MTLGQFSRHSHILYVHVLIHTTLKYKSPTTWDTKSEAGKRGILNKVRIWQHGTAHVFSVVSTRPLWELKILILMVLSIEVYTDLEVFDSNYSLYL